jgi:diguanylate cyclase (GGDEF)-like protein
MKRHRLWIVVAVVLVIAGSIGSILAAAREARTHQAQSRAALTTTSAEVVSTLDLAIQHEEDLVVNAGAVVLADPHVSNTEFVNWMTSASVMGRYPELQALGFVAAVPAAQLPAFEARMLADPPTPLGADGKYAVVPPGARATFCLAAAGWGRNAGITAPVGLDLCTTAVGPLLMGARDSGLGADVPYAAGTQTWLGIETPVYAGGGIPATVAARRASILGWVGTAVDQKVVLARALQGHPGVAVSMNYRRSSTGLGFASGQAPRDAQSVVTELSSGWTITTSGAVVSSGVFADRYALLVLCAGVVLSLLLGLLVLVLGTGRARALRMVAERTGELRHQALHDALTGLPNRALITDRIEQLLFRDRRHGTLGSTLYVDLDEFKNVNDTLGHEVGDRLLVAVAARMKNALRDADTIGRMGGDEFIVLIDGASMADAPEIVARRLLHVMRQPFKLDGVAVPLIVTASIGIATGDRTNAGDLLRDADVALYQAKAAGKNRYEFFHPEMQSQVSHRIELEFDLRSALDGDQFRLVYQPIYKLADLSLIGVEALLRWDHPTRGLVQPDDFIPILEQTGQIREVGCWVLRQACQQMAQWHARGDALTVSVNVSGRQLDDDAIVEHIREALELSGLDATSLVVEVTESALMRNADTTALRLKAIKALGVRVAVDDFGTGYSSLAYLQKFAVDCLKIDRTFVNGISASRESRALLSTLVRLGKDLGLKTLAEGVETTEQLDHLRGQGVDEVQGFLLSRPLDPQTLETQLLSPSRPPAASTR